MTMFLEQPEGLAPHSIAGGEAGLGMILRRSRDASLYVDTTGGEYLALVEAYNRRIKSIASATGQQLKNPLTEAETLWRQSQAVPQSPIPGLQTERETHKQIAERLEADFQERISDLARKNPDASAAIAADRSLRDDALGIIRESEQLNNTAFASRQGAGRWLAALGGGFQAMLRDPVNVGSLALGGGPGAARTVVTRIATVAAKEAAINASVEAVLQPMIQNRRKRAGLPHGFAEAARNVGFAALFGGAIGGGARGVGEGFAKLFPAAQAERLTDHVARDISGVREQLPAEVRGAVDAAEVISHTDKVRPEGLSSRAHDDAVARADVLNEDPATAAQRVALDLEKIERITNEIVGAPAGGRADPQPQTLSDFLISAGGIRAQGGELEQIGATAVTKRFRGRLVRDDGLNLDRAREAAAEAGFFDDLYGTPAAAVEQSTIRDLIDAVDRDINGQPVTASAEVIRANPADIDAANRAYVEDRIAELQQLAGPGVDDRVIARAFDLVERDGLDPADAVHDAVMELPLKEQGRSGDPLPGWADEDLERASNAARGEDLPGGLEDPRQVDDDFLFSEADLDGLEDLDIPFGDQVGEASMLVEDLKRSENLAHVVEACRV